MKDQISKLDVILRRLQKHCRDNDINLYLTVENTAERSRQNVSCGNPATLLGLAEMAKINLIEKLREGDQI